MRSRARVYAHSYNTILSLLAKDFAVGAFLPFQSDLAKSCQVSQATISRLLIDLEKIGLIVPEKEGRRLVRKPSKRDLLPQPRSLSRREEIEQDIMGMLTSGELRPGTSFSELALAKKFGVTTGTVREALHKLAKLGIFTKPARRQWQFTKLGADRINELFDLRELLEVYALKRYFRQSNREIRPFAALLKAMQKLKKSTRITRSDITQTDWDLHRTILATSGNHYLGEHFQFAIFATQIQGFHYSDTSPDIRRRSMLGLNTHIELLKAIVAGDESKSVQLLKQHLETSRNDLLQLS